MVVALEQKNYCEQQLLVKNDTEAELQKQLELKNATIKLLENMVEMQKKLDATKDKLHADELKAAKPTFWDNLGKIGIGIGIGIMVAVGVVLAL